MENETTTAVKEKGFVVWLTGIPGSGKTTIGDIVIERLRGMGHKVESLDGDEVRRNLSPDLGFSKEDRETHARRVAYVSKLLSRNGVAVVVALISPYRSFREHVRNLVDDFVEVHVDASVEECIKRDPKGLYKKALAGEISIDRPADTYEAPETLKSGADREQTPGKRRRRHRNGHLGYLSCSHLCAWSISARSLPSKTFGSPCWDSHQKMGLL
jgi:adenylyl-sulfate kinase